MRKQCLWITLLLLCVSVTLFAERRTESEAREIASKYLKTSNTTPTLRRAKLRPNQEQSSLPYYIYNRASGGFAVVSGSDLLPALIGYSETGALDPNGDDMPEGLRYWLTYAAEAADYVEAHPEASIVGEKLYGKDYGPLLNKITYNQDYPYNDQCPYGTYTGCMATAMSQVMAYHQHPLQGKGVVSTRYNGTTYSADLSQSTFDWNNMLPSYKGISTQAQRDAVAQLHYHVGLSLQLEYGTDATAGVSTKYATSLRDNFGYNRNVCLINRDCFTYAEWIDILLGELEAGRPILYDGVSGSGGHAFVVDGYRASDGFFHVNWGWGGASNGYYNITLLNPSTTGIGATLSSGFTAYQDAVINITPEQGVGTYYAPIYTYGNGGITCGSIGQVIPLGGEANISMEYVCNYTDDIFEGTYGACIMQNGREVARVEAGTLRGRGATFNQNGDVYVYGGNWNIPTTLQDGDYRVYVYIQQNGYPYNILHTGTAKPNFVDMSVRDGKATFAMQATYPTALTIGQWSFEQETPTTSTNHITCTVTNTSNQVEYGTIRLQFDAPYRLTKTLTSEPMRFMPGESREVTFWTEMLDYGQYTIRNVKLDRHNGGGRTSIIDDPITYIIYRDAETTRTMLTQRLQEIVNIMAAANYGNEEGQYPISARDRMQQVISRIQQSGYQHMGAAQVQTMLDELNAEADAFFRSMNIDVVIKNWSYVADAPVNTGWTPGALEQPTYFGISINADELQAYRGCKVLGIQAHFGRRTSYQNPQPEELTTQVLLLDYYGYPGDRILAAGPEVHPTTQQYADYYFDEPYVIGDGGLMAVCKVILHSSMYSAIAACSDVAREGACWMNNGSGWSDIYKSNGGGASAHAIKLIIQGSGENVVDAALENVAADAVMVGQEITVKGTIQNTYHRPISSTVMQWTLDDGTLGTVTVNRNIAPEQREEFQFTLPAMDRARLHNMQLRILTLDGMNDMVPTNSTTRVSIPVSGRNYTRRVVVEDHVSTQCGYSPRGINTYAWMRDQYGDRFTGISIHTDKGNLPDPMAFPSNAYSKLLASIPNTPTGLVDRNPALYTNLESTSLAKMIEQESRLGVASVKAEATYNPTTQRIVVSAKTEFGYDYDQADYRLAYIIVEDQVGPYVQNNYSGVTQAILHDNVARDIVPGYDGQPGSVPSSGVAGSTKEYACRFPMPGNVDNPQNTRIVCLLLDNETGRILNSCESPLTLDNTNDEGEDIGGNEDEDDEDDDDDYGDYDDEDEDDSGLPTIEVTIRDGMDFDNSNELMTDILHYRRDYPTTDWEPLYVPFAIEYGQWKQKFEIAQWEEVRQYDDNQDGTPERTTLRFAIIGEGGSVLPNRPYLIRALEPGSHDLVTRKNVVYTNQENTLTMTTEDALLTLQGNYSWLTAAELQEYYTLGTEGALQPGIALGQGLSPMRWYLSISSLDGASTSTTQDVNLIVADAFPQEEEGDIDDGGDEDGEDEGDDTGDEDEGDEDDDSGDTGGEEGDDSGDTGGEEGDDSGDTGGEEGDDSGDTGGEEGDDSGDTGGEEGDDSGDTGGEEGDDSGDTGGEEGDDSGDTGGEEGDDSGNTGGEEGDDSGDTGGEEGDDNDEEEESGTGVEGIDMQKNMAIYSLDGRYVGSDPRRLQRGIYICNGKKLRIR